MAEQEVLGGAFVEIGADLSKLRAAEAEAKLIAQRIDSLKPSFKLVGDTSRLAADLAAAGQKLTLRVPVQLDFTQAIAQLAAFQTNQSLKFSPNVDTSGGNTRRVKTFPNQWLSELFPDVDLSTPPGPGGMPPPAQKSGNSLAKNPPGISRVSGRATLYSILGQYALPTIAAAGALSTAEGLGYTGSAIGELYNHADDAVIGKSRDAARAALRSFPVLGPYVERYGGYIGSGINRLASAGANAATGRGFESDVGYADRINEEVKKEDITNDRRHARALILGQNEKDAETQTRVNNLALSMRGKTGAEKETIQAQAALDEFNTKYPTAANGSGRIRDDQIALQNRLSAAQEDERTTREARMTLLGGESVGADLRAAGRFGDADEIKLKARMQAEVLTAPYSERTAIINRQASEMREFWADRDRRSDDLQSASGSSIKSSELRLAGDLGGAQQVDIKAAYRDKIQAAQQQFGVGSKEATLVSSEADQKAFEAMELRKRQIANDTENAIATARESTLRLSHQNYKADLDGFDEATRYKISAIQDATEKEIEANKRASERKVFVQQQAEQEQVTVNGYISAGKIATLRSQRRDFEAEQLEFDTETQRQRLGVDANAKDLGAFDKSRSEQRDAMLANQGHVRDDINAGLDTRVGVAGAIGKGQDRLAGVLAELGAMRGELRDARPQFAPKIAATEQAELQGMEQSLLRPKRYATEWDSLREAPGGPGGDAEDQTNSILKAIHDLMKEIAGKGFPALAG